MFCSRTSNNTINRIHERALRLCYDNITDKSFEELIVESKQVKIHNRNLHLLMTEVYKNLNNLSPPIMEVFFISRCNIHGLRNFRDLYVTKKRTIRYGLETVSFKAPQLWQTLPGELKSCTSLSVFKSKIKQWQPQCPCHLCKNFIQGLGFV